MIDIYTIAKEISKNLNVDYETALTICQHPFMFTVNTMKNETDAKDILFNELFKFKLKSRFKENKQNKYSPK